MLAFLLSIILVSLVAYSVCDRFDCRLAMPPSLDQFDVLFAALPQYDWLNRNE